MNIIEKNLNSKFLCRELFIKHLCQYVGDSKEGYPNAVYVYGHTGTGKTAIIKEFLRLSDIRYAFLNCIECHTGKLLFEYILNSLWNHKLSAENKYQVFKKCDCLQNFLRELKELNSQNSYIICIKNAERLRDMDSNILSTLLQLQQFTGLNICTILVSQIPFEKYYLKTGLPNILTLYCQQYTKTEIHKILLNDFSHAKQTIKENLTKQSIDKTSTNMDLLNNLESDFYDNYLNIFLNVFYRACRDLPELRMISLRSFQTYCEPVLNGKIEKNDVRKLWNYISNNLRTALSSIYMRIDNHEDIDSTLESAQDVKNIMHHLELPYYAKFLLIAAFLASYNAPKEDKRLFVKNHGKQRKKVKSINMKVSEKMSTSVGPKNFTIDRLLAIFYAILDEKVGLTCNLLAQISTLVKLKFLTFLSGENNIMNGSARLQCTASIAFVLHIGKVVGFNVRHYLCDAM